MLRSSLLRSWSQVLAVGSYAALAVYAYLRPTSWAYSKKYRPRVLNFLPQATRTRLEEERLAYKKAQYKKWKMAVNQSPEAAPLTEDSPALKGKAAEEAAQAEMKEDMAKPWIQQHADDCSARCGLCTGQRLSYVCLLLLNIIVGIVGYYTHRTEGYRESTWWAIGKASGYSLDFNFALVVLPMLRSLQTALRGKSGATSDWIPIDDPGAFHIFIALLIAIGSVVHIVAHLEHMKEVDSAQPLQDDPLGYFGLSWEESMGGTSFWEQWTQLSDRFGRFAPISGMILVAMMVPMYLTSTPCIRRSRNLVTRFIGGYNLFWRVHSLWPLLFVVLLLHCPGRLWIWLFFPIMIILVDRLLLRQRHKPYVVLIRAKLLPFDVVNLVFELPAGFTYQAGQYIFLGWRNEWHPFTLTSAPEEGVLSVHIRAPDQLDWCSALRRRVLVEAPAAALKGISAPAKGEERVAPGRVVEYTACMDPRRNVAYARPQRSADAGEEEGGVQPTKLGASARRTMEKTKTTDSFDTVMLPGAKLPPDAVLLQLSGPFGAPAQRVWEFDTIMVVGAGINVTPFVSILRSVQLRAQQRAAILGASAAHGSMARDSPGQRGRLRRGTEGAEGLMSPRRRASPAPPKVERRRDEADGKLYTYLEFQRRYKEEFSEPEIKAYWDQMKGEETPQGRRSASVEAAREGWHSDQLRELVQDIIPVPSVIHFYWIVRNQQEFDWFYDLLSAAVNGPARGVVDINVFTTGEVELTQVKRLACANNQFFGRPNWRRVFRTTKQQHPREHVGVFLCGSGDLASQLEHQSKKHSDAPDILGGTRFSFFREEHF